MSTLEDVLRVAQRRGWLGSAPVSEHRRHAEAFAAAVGPPTNAVDLGTGGGVPGLVLAERWPDAEIVLIESDRARAAFLETAVVDLGLVPRVQILHTRAETAGHDSALRAAFDVVTARSFGPPSVVAECAAPLLRVGGTLIVSDPPEGGGSRWPADPLQELGLAVVAESVDGPRLTVLNQTTPCPPAFARRPGVPQRRPLF